MSDQKGHTEHLASLENFEQIRTLTTAFYKIVCDYFHITRFIKNIV